MAEETPRIAPLRQGEFSEAAKAALAAIAGTPSTEGIPDAAATMLRHPVLFRLQTELALHLFKAGTLSPRHRELAILRIAWLCQSPYTWAEHVEIARQAVPLSGEEIERVTKGSAAPEWDRADRAILGAVEELHGRARISDESWAVLTAGFDDRQLIELPVLISLYQGFAYVANALRIQPPAGSSGLAAR